jgi:hypothetical protein
VIQEVELPNDRLRYSVDTKEQYMVWLPHDFHEVASNNGERLHLLNIQHSVNMTVDTELKHLTCPIQDVKMQNNLLRVKRRYFVEIPIQNMNMDRGMAIGIKLPVNFLGENGENCQIKVFFSYFASFLQNLFLWAAKM